MTTSQNSEPTPLKRGTWSPEEDEKLIAYINRYGIWNWNEMPRAAGLSRSGKSCRLRWMNYLRPNIKRGNFTKEEEETIINLHEMLGNRWSAIASKLPGRTDNEIKNYWHTHLKKLLKSNATDQLQQMNISETDVPSSKTTPEASSSSGRSHATSMSSPIPSTADSFKNFSHQIIEGNFGLSAVARGLVFNCLMEQSSTCNPGSKSDENQTKEVNPGISDIQSLTGQPFSAEELDMMNNYGATETNQTWLEESIYPHASHTDNRRDLWMKF